MKLLIAALAVVGCMFLINAYVPSAWVQGFTVKGYLIPYAAMVLGGVVYFALKLKSK